MRTVLWIGTEHVRVWISPSHTERSCVDFLYNFCRRWGCYSTPIEEESVQTFVKLSDWVSFEGSPRVTIDYLTSLFTISNITLKLNETNFSPSIFSYNEIIWPDCSFIQAISSWTFFWIIFYPPPTRLKVYPLRQIWVWARKADCGRIAQLFQPLNSS